MRVLKFIVDKQIIVQDPECDFEGIVPGTEGYLQAEFSFSPEWFKTARVATFHDNSSKDISPVILKDGKTCIIPAEVLTGDRFFVGVIGKGERLKIITNETMVRQNGGK